jgi:hypothetical protein
VERRGRLLGQGDEVERLQGDPEDALLQARHVQQVADELPQARQGVGQLGRVFQVVGSILPRRPAPDEVDAPTQRRQVVAQVVGQNGDELLGGALAALLGRVARDALHQLGAVGDHADPAGDHLQEAQVVLGEVLGPCGGGLQHPLHLAVHRQRHRDGGAHAERLDHAD